MFFSLMQVVKDFTHFSPSGHSTIVDLALLSDSPRVTECTVMLPWTIISLFFK